MNNDIIWFDQLALTDIDKVGGKNASLGEMIGRLHEAGIKVPNGFATTIDAYHRFIQSNQLDSYISSRLKNLDVSDVQVLSQVGQDIRQKIVDTDLPETFVNSITQAYQTLGEQVGGEPLVAVRSSANTEDLAEASFAGQQASYLNIVGIDHVLEAIKYVFASVFNDRAIAYRVHHGFQHAQVGLSAGIQFMVRSSQACSGVMFSLDTESGFEDVVFITASYGLGEAVVQGIVNPDEFYVYKPALRAERPSILRRNLGSKLTKVVSTGELGIDRSIKSVDVEPELRGQFCLSDDDIISLAKQAEVISMHYRCAMDIEWAKDSESGDLFIVQARPETVKNRESSSVIERFLLQEKGRLLVEGRSIGQRIGCGQVRVIDSIYQMDSLQPGEVLVADATDPDWEPVMKRASAIVTNRGGRTCHAAIIARELGIPAVVGCGNATDLLDNGQEVTVSCAEGDTGLVYQGMLNFERQTNNVSNMPDLPLKLMMNVGNPDRAFDYQALPNQGVGLARLEFIINRMIGVHPKALMHFDQLPAAVKQSVTKRISGYGSPHEFYIEKMVEGIATIGAAFCPKRVIVRLSDFKSNEYANLIGGSLYEPEEENPMLGFRGASRYVAESFRDCFDLECQAIRHVRNKMGLKNIEIMVPFVRTVSEAKRVIELLAENGLERGKDDLKIMMMCELPANALLAEQFLEHFDGFSIGSNDLTQLTLGLDRDSGIVAHLFDERNDAVKVLLQNTIKACRKAGKYVGICGQGPSDHPDFAKWLMEQGIDSLSLSPDSVLETWMFLAENQQEKL